MSGEKEKIQFALELAIHEISKKSKNPDEEEAENVDASTIKDRKASTVISAKKYKGTSTLIKLPYVIGTKEYSPSFSGEI